MNRTPLVSAIMPTCREGMMKDAIRMFDAQTYKAKELVSVKDDGTLTIGEMRNIAIRKSTGSIIIHWDDDDWHDPRRIEFQVDAISNYDVSGASEAYWYNYQTDEAYLYEFNDKYKIGGTLCYWRRIWEQCSFDPKRHVGEDMVWQARAPIRSYGPDLPLGMYVASLGEHNTSKKDVGGSGWTIADAEKVKALMEKR